MTDLVEFLRERLAEDEAAALAAADFGGGIRGYHWGVSSSHTEDGGNYTYWSIAATVVAGSHEQVVEVVGCGVGGGGGAHTEQVALHAVRHDPARVLREVGAKRLLLEDHPILPETYPRPVVGGQEVGGPYYPFGCGNCHSEADTGEVNGFGYCLIWTSGALPYADHPDYQQEWTP